MATEEENARPRAPLTGRFQLDTDLVPQGDQPKAIAQIVERVRSGEKFVTLLGVTGSGKTFTMAHAIEQLQRPTLVVSPNKTLAAQLVSEFRSLFPKSSVEYFVSYYDYYQPEAYVPQIDLYIEKDAAINEEIEKLRHRATQALLTRRDTLVVASVSCIYSLGSPADYAQSVIHLAKGEESGRRSLIDRLLKLKYQRNDYEFKRGRFRVRGGTVDIAASNDLIHRVVFDGNTIASLLELDRTTQEELRELPELSIFPATHFLSVDERLKATLAEIDAEKESRVAELTRAGKLVEAQRLKSRTEYDLEMIRETGYCSGIENYARYFSGRKPGDTPYTLLDYFPEDFLVFLDESHVTIPQLQGMFKGDRSRKDNLVEFGWRLPSCRDNRPLRFPEFLARVPQGVFVSATPGPFELEHTRGVVEQVIRPTGLVDPEIEVRPLKGHIEDLIGELRGRIAKNERSLVTTLTKATAEELAHYLANVGMKVQYLHSDVETLKRIEVLRDLRLGRFDVLVGINLLREGLDLPEVSLVAILDADKEGYLRSETSLIQTAGRASRNVMGRVILYADRITGSMQRAIAEMSRRRELQISFNREHQIVPETIRKEVRSILEAEEAPSGELSMEGLGKRWKDKLPLLLANLEEEMRIAAERLDFEEAARIRDRLRSLESRAFAAKAVRPARARAA